MAEAAGELSAGIGNVLVQVIQKNKTNKAQQQKPLFVHRSLSVGENSDTPNPLTSFHTNTKTKKKIINCFQKKNYFKRENLKIVRVEKKLRNKTKQKKILLQIKIIVRLNALVMALPTTTTITSLKEVILCDWCLGAHCYSLLIAQLFTEEGIFLLEEE